MIDTPPALVVRTSVKVAASAGVKTILISEGTTLMMTAAKMKLIELACARAW